MRMCYKTERKSKKEKKEKGDQKGQIMDLISISLIHLDIPVLILTVFKCLFCKINSRPNMPTFF